ncbi:MAG: hypothetical protein QME68_06665 [Elusimicrobiota bacterium]|nr:hypothetical protein [Elusimicrobiota bacterium]
MALSTHVHLIDVVERATPEKLVGDAGGAKTVNLMVTYADCRNAPVGWARITPPEPASTKNN